MFLNPSQMFRIIYDNTRALYYLEILYDVKRFHVFNILNVNMNVNVKCFLVMNDPLNLSAFCFKYKYSHLLARPRKFDYFFLLSILWLKFFVAQLHSNYRLHSMITGLMILIDVRAWFFVKFKCPSTPFPSYTTNISFFSNL